MASVSFPNFSPAKSQSRTLRGRSSRLSSWLDFRRASHPWLRTLGAIVVLAVFAETGVRLIEYATDLPFDDARSAAKLKLAPGSMLGGRAINAAGYWDGEFTDAAPVTSPRIAVLGGLTTLGGDAETNFVAQLESRLGDVEIDHFGLPQAGPREHAAQLVRDVLKRKPKRVLICLDATDEFAPRHVRRSRLDCRTLEFVNAMFTPSTAAATDGPRSLHLTPMLDYDEYVRSRAPSVLAASKAKDAEREAHRRDAQAALERLVRACNKQNIPVTLVLAPGEFQLSTTLTAAFCRRMQLEPTDLELDLPQRRWSALAEHLQVSKIDLLPALREKGEIVYLPNSAEWNERGQTIVAETIARDLKNRGI